MSNGAAATASVAIDGSKFKAVSNRDRNFTKAKVQRRRAQLEESFTRYLSQLDTADRQEPTEALATKVTRLTENDKAEGENGQACRLREADAGFARSPGLSDRSRQPLDGHERPRLGSVMKA